MAPPIVSSAAATISAFRFSSAYIFFSRAFSSSSSLSRFMLATSSHRTWRTVCRSWRCSYRAGGTAPEPARQFRAPSGSGESGFPYIRTSSCAESPVSGRIYSRVRSFSGGLHQHRATQGNSMPLPVFPRSALFDGCACVLPGLYKKDSDGYASSIQRGVLQLLRNLLHSALVYLQAINTATNAKETS